MNMREAVIRRFTDSGPTKSQAPRIQAINDAVSVLEEYASRATIHPGGYAVTPGNTFYLSHSEIEERTRACALAIFDVIPEVIGDFDVDEALRTLLVVRGLLHNALTPPADALSGEDYREYAVLRLAEVRIQATNAVLFGG